MLLTCTVPGEPVAQGRPRAFRLPNGHIRAYDPPKSRGWKATAQAHLQDAMEALEAGTAPFQGPLAVTVRALFTCPRSDWRAREPRSRRWHAKRPDGENVAKAVLDAATGIVWLDDAQVARLVVEKRIGAQGEAPRVEIAVEALGSL